MAKFTADTLFSSADGTEAATIVAVARDLFAGLAALDEDARMDAVNQIRTALREHSPMKDEPVDCVQWVPAEQVAGNEYNPNVVAPPEMKLLALSIKSDGFTQPIVAWPVEGGYEVIDGFHRHRVGKEDKAVRKRLRGRLPIAVINSDRAGREDRQASTIRHNRARGQHTVEGMSEIVVELARRGKTDQWIGQELGLDPDEVRRLRQITGLAEMFAEQEFSEAWEAEDPWSGSAGTE
jgi:ParB-like chromosome segregation protein Spo0J